MLTLYRLPITLLLLLVTQFTQPGMAQLPAAATHRLQVHFSPKANWINDPNGMVYYKGTYHLFFQYHPNSTQWGPMHWGHATSSDLVNWKEASIALYPDSLGTIFSGSAVADINNTSGFGKDGQVPLVAIFTHHNAALEKTTNTFQNQSIAYSLDEGKTWVKYANNPVVVNPGITDFRDPKVSWYEAGKKWIMTLATLDRITFYSSPDLKNWQRESEFGQNAGAHGGVWECPDLFSMEQDGKIVWVLLVSINPGGPNKGSATQYFIGDFDGKTFTAAHTDTRWVDYGTDNYAGITWSNTGDQKIFIGWMSNWLYAGDLPTTTWKGAMTLPRELALQRVGREVMLTSRPVPQLTLLQGKAVTHRAVKVSSHLDFTKKLGALQLPCRVKIEGIAVKDFALVFSNPLGEALVIGYEKATNQYYIDRSKSGKVAFNKSFPGRQAAPRLALNDVIDLDLVIDVSSVELFADKGLSVMTAVYFPNQTYNKLSLRSPLPVTMDKITYTPLKAAPVK